MDQATRKYGESKIVAVRDYTIADRDGRYGIYSPVKGTYLAEGDVLYDEGHAEGDSITVGETTYTTTGLDASDDKLYFSMTKFENEGQDLNADGAVKDNFATLLVDDKVYIDTDNDHDFTDETGYANGETGTFDVNVSDDLLGANFRISDLDTKGKFASILLILMDMDLMCPVLQLLTDLYVQISMEQ